MIALKRDDFSTNITPNITIRCLVLSYTHADSDWRPDLSSIPVDMAIHCGDLVEESKFSEFLVIAGNHDFTLDEPLFRRKIAVAAAPVVEPDLVKKAFGDCGEAQRLFTDPDTREGACQRRRIDRYASLYTPSPHAETGFQYKRDQVHNFWIGGVSTSS
ncbi:hypothetical protein N657DRAFT_671971 [Parathielavia appendiculata]|uniref:Calcineurin-like phosphoesterase domain-containing protein n=1 Tax=Parathielavia appendiculata TaxID=2587402 RepID=A0AAN6U041_9PEZI|nr:hypothetical protein N657DRAFT_671971 [Parathielavia appendiculata]